VLEAVKASGPLFVMVELGAGYGRWMVSAAAALRQLRPTADIRLVGVEADPNHYRWMLQHFADNGISPKRHLLIQAAISDSLGSVFFHSGDSSNWYGQAIAEPGYVANLKAMPTWQAHNNAYVREPSWKDRLFRKRRRFIVEVPSFDLASILVRVEGIVDLIDMDIQGAEAKVVSSSLDVLGMSVRALHIATHSRENEDTLRSLLQARGWELTQDYACLGLRPTPFGMVAFCDGVQSWKNPTLSMNSNNLAESLKGVEILQ
jgi:FkbM family methyltransferase